MIPATTGKLYHPVVPFITGISQAKSAVTEESDGFSPSAEKSLPEHKLSEIIIRKPKLCHSYLPPSFPLPPPSFFLSWITPSTVQCLLLPVRGRGIYKENTLSALPFHQPLSFCKVFFEAASFYN